MGVPSSRSVAECRQEPHDQAATLIYRTLGNASVLSQPVLELHHPAVEHWNWNHARYLSPHDPALAEELDELAHSPHVVAGDMRLTAPTWTTAAMPRETINDALVDVGDRDLDQRQPVPEVAGQTFIAVDCQQGMPSLRQMARELRHPWGEIVRMHAPPPGAAILICLGHSMFPSGCHQDSEGDAELCGVGNWKQRAKLLKKGRASNGATTHST